MSYITTEILSWSELCNNESVQSTIYNSRNDIQCRPQSKISLIRYKGKRMMGESIESLPRYGKYFFALSLMRLASRWSENICAERNSYCMSIKFLRSCELFRSMRIQGFYPNDSIYNRILWKHRLNAGRFSNIIYYMGW
jgi:pentatricopeptide repeat protein